MGLWSYLRSINKQTENLARNAEKSDTYQTVKQAVEEARLEKARWNRVDNVVAVFSDLKGSSEISQMKRKITYAKVLEYLNFPFIQIHIKFGAEFLDIKGDGGIALYTGHEAEVRAFLASETYRTFMKKFANGYFNRYGLNLIVHAGIDKGNLLIKRIGDRSNSFYVWSGTTINSASLICKNLRRTAGNYYCIGVSEAIYEKLNRDSVSKWLVWSCGCLHGNKNNLWDEDCVEEVSNLRYWKNKFPWCDKHGELYLSNVVKKLNMEVSL